MTTLLRLNITWLVAIIIKSLETSFNITINVVCRICSIFFCSSCRWFWCPGAHVLGQLYSPGNHVGKCYVFYVAQLIIIMSLAYPPFKTDKGFLRVSKCVLCRCRLICKRHIGSYSPHHLSICWHLTDLWSQKRTFITRRKVLIFSHSLISQEKVTRYCRPPSLFGNLFFHIKNSCGAIEAIW